MCRVVFFFEWLVNSLAEVVDDKLFTSGMFRLELSDIVDSVFPQDDFFFIFSPEFFNLCFTLKVGHSILFKYIYKTLIARFKKVRKHFLL